MSLPRISLHIGDYKKDTGHLRAAGHGAYFLLCLHYYATGGLPTDDRQLATIACMTDREWREHKEILKAFFKAGEWKHKRIDEEIALANTKYEARAAAGKKGGNAKANAKQTASNATAKSYQPITDNLEEEAKSASSSEARKRASRLPDNWFPSEADAQFALSKGFSEAEAQREFEKFRNYWTAKSGKDATKLDWSATWRNWILNALERKGNSNGNSRQAGPERLANRAAELADEARRREFEAGIVGPGTSVGIA